MSTHPNVILMCILTPNDLARKTYRSIVEEFKANDWVEEEGTSAIKIGAIEYHCKVMEEGYDDDWQIRAKEGDIVVFDLVTYGYGENIAWEKLEARKNELESWAKEICERLSCLYKIVVTANYW